MAYTDLVTVRAMEGMSDSANYPDDSITEGIAWATTLIDEYTGTSWEAKAFDLTISGSDTSRLTLDDPYDGRRILFPRSITAITVDGVDEIAEVGDWALFPEGYVIRDEGTFTYTFPGNNINIQGTAGMTTTVPDDIAFCARTLARQYVIDLISRVDDRAVMMTTEMGTIRLSQPGSKYPTGLPQVDAILNRRLQRGPSIA